MASVEDIRKSLTDIPLKTVLDCGQNLSKLPEVLLEYERIEKLSKKLLAPLDGQFCGEVLNNHTTEFWFFKTCQTRLKSMMEVADNIYRHKRGVKYIDIRDNAKRDHTERAINTVLDGDDTLFDLKYDCLLVKEVYDRFCDIEAAYVQRSFRINNIIKANEIGIIQAPFE